VFCELLDGGHALSSAIETAQATITDAEVRAQILELYNTVVDSSGDWLDHTRFSFSGPRVFNELFLIGLQRSFLPDFNLHVLLLKDILEEKDDIGAPEQVLPVFAVLLKCEVPILRALEVIQLDSSSEEVKDFVHSAKTGIEKGQPLCLALAKFPAVANEEELALIEQGEQDGSLVEKLLQIYDSRSK
jgi:hypothetical protein